MCIRDRHESVRLPQSTLQKEVAAYDAQTEANYAQAVEQLTLEQRKIVHAFETAGFDFVPNQPDDPSQRHIIFANAKTGYPLAYESWEDARCV